MYFEIQDNKNLWTTLHGLIADKIDLQVPKGAFYSDEKWVQLFDDELQRLIELYRNTK